MSKFTDLADLLDSASRALREADRMLDFPDSSKRLDGLDGYKALSVRLRNSLRRDDYNHGIIATVKDLCSQSEEAILDRRNVGGSVLEELKEFMSAHQLNFGGRQ